MYTMSYICTLNRNPTYISYNRIVQIGISCIQSELWFSLNQQLSNLHISIRSVLLNTPWIGYRVGWVFWVLHTPSCEGNIYF